MNRKRLRRLAFRARLWAESAARRTKEDFGIPDDLTGMCGIVSVYLGKRLEKVGIPYEICCSLGHAFIESCGYVVDATATQFDESRTMVRKAGPWQGQNTYWYPEQRFANVNEFVQEYHCEWPEHQRSDTFEETLKQCKKKILLES